jgi:hypothetical protein
MDGFLGDVVVWISGKASGIVRLLFGFLRYMNYVQLRAAYFFGNLRRRNRIGAEVVHELLLEFEKIRVLKDLAGFGVNDVSGFYPDGVGVNQVSVAVQADGAVSLVRLFAIGGAQFVEKCAFGIGVVSIVACGHGGNFDFFGCGDGVKPEGGCGGGEQECCEKVDEGKHSNLAREGLGARQAGLLMKSKARIR